MKTYKITVAGKEIDVLQNEDGSFNKPNIVKELESYGTALKPAFEPICMAMKPLSEKNYVSNVLKWGTGGINIDESRVEGKPRTTHKDRNYTGNKSGEFLGEGLGGLEAEIPSARFPANLIHDNSEEVRECFPELGRSSKLGKNCKSTGGWSTGLKMSEKGKTNDYSDSGNASRFFKSIIYTAKASKSERNKGMDGLEAKPMYKGDGSAQSLEIFGSTDGGRDDRKNNHPTVKPIALMEYLINMVTKEGQTVLDPFTGSGTTLIAAKNLGRNYIGIELEPEYVKIAEARLKGTPERLV